MRLRGFILVACVIIACTHAAKKLSRDEQHAFAIAGSADFGIVTINQSSAPRAFQIAPEGGAIQENTVFSIFTCANFPIVSVGSVAASGSAVVDLVEPVYRRCSLVDGDPYGGGECLQFEVRTLDFAIKFSPTVTGTQTCNISIQGFPADKTFQVTGVGKLPDHAVLFAPRLQAMSFGPVRVNEASDPIAVKVTNTGLLGLSVTASKVGAPQFELQTGTLGSQTIAPGNSDTFGITCRPTAAVALDGDLLITTNSDQALDTSLPIDLGCVGINSAVAMTPNASITLEARVGESAMRTFTLENDQGTASATIESVTVTHPDLGVTQPTDSSLDIGEQATFVVTYTPTTSAHGKIDTLVVKIQNEVDRTVDIIADAGVVMPLAEPNTIEFGPVCVGKSKETQLFVYAGGDSKFTVTGFTPPGPPGVPFTVTSALGEVRPMPARNDVAFDIVSAPTTPGEFKQTLAIQTDAPPVTLDVVLRTVGLDPSITALPALIPFARTRVNANTEPRTAFFTNCTDETTLVSDIRLDGDSSEDFVITDIRPPLEPGMTLEPGKQIEIEVQMIPRSVGGKTAVIAIDYGAADETAQVELTGDAFVQLERDSYYRCTTGGSGAVWPLILVVWLAVRRRRR